MKNLDWGSLSFGYMKTDYNVRCYYRDGKWGEIAALTARCVFSASTRMQPVCSLPVAAS